MNFTVFINYYYTVLLPATNAFYINKGIQKLNTIRIDVFDYCYNKKFKKNYF